MEYLARLLQRNQNSQNEKPHVTKSAFWSYLMKILCDTHILIWYLSEHHDLFDRLLISQAKADDLILLLMIR